MVKFPSITLSEGSSYVVIANAMINVGEPGTYIVYAKGNPKTLYKILKSEGILNHTIYAQLENFETMKNHVEVFRTQGDLTLYKYVPKEK